MSDMPERICIEKTQRGRMKQYTKGERLHKNSKLVYDGPAEPKVRADGRRANRGTFKCECGNYKIIAVASVKSGNTISCGCYNTAKRIKHGSYTTRLYSIWTGIRIRCHSKDSRVYKWYGARGIKMCDEWLNSYETFKQWSEKNGYSKELQIDRINNNKGYFPDNCRWTTPIKNTRNTRKSKWWYLNGVRYESCTSAAKILGVGSTTIVSWCDGFIKNGKKYPPKPGCYSKPKYITPPQE